MLSCCSKSKEQSSLTITLALALGWALVGCTTVVPEPPASTPPGRASAELLPADTLLLRAARAVVRTAPLMEQVWPGFWLPDQAFIFYRPNEAVLLISPVQPPADFLPLRNPAVPRELQGRAYLYRGTLPGLEGSFHIDYPAGATTATAVAVQQEAIRATLTTLFHEAFHGYQSRHFATGPSDAGGFVEPAQISAPEFRAMAEVERRMLAEALDLPADSLRQFLSEYLAVRMLRNHSVPEDVWAVERHLERIEGSATLVGLDAGLLATGAARSQLPESLRPYLTRSLDSFSGGLSERLIRWRTYGTGAAIGFLLDRLGEDWRLQVEGGVTFDDLLGMAVRFDTTVAPPLAMDALGRFGFRDLLAEGVAATERAEIHSEEDFDALAPVRLVVDFVVPVENGRPNMTINFSAGDSGFSQLESNLIALPNPEVFTLQVPGGSLVVRGHPVLQDVREVAQERLRITVLLPTVPAILGEPRLLDGEYRRERLHIEAAGLLLRLEEPVLVQVGKNEWVIRTDSARR